jgi:hypothetical protein
MHTDIILVSDDDFQIPIKFMTDASHLPPLEQITDKSMLKFSNIIQVGSRMSEGHVCYSIQTCIEKKCKGSIVIRRESEDTILWLCDRCLTKGQITNFLITTHDASKINDKLKGPISLEISSKHFSAIDKIRGLPEDTHMMLMTANLDEGSTVILSGKEDAFHGLASTISEELEFDLAKKTDQKSLFSLMVTIEEILESEVHLF